MSECVGNGRSFCGYAKCGGGQAGQGLIAGMEARNPTRLTGGYGPRRLAARLAAGPAAPGRLSRLRARSRPLRTARARAGAGYLAAPALAAAAMNKSPGSDPHALLTRSPHGCAPRHAVPLSVLLTLGL